MYHHRYQPQTSNLANKNNSAFGSLNHHHQHPQSKQQHQQSVNTGAAPITAQRPHYNPASVAEVGPNKIPFYGPVAPSVNHSARYHHGNGNGNGNSNSFGGRPNANSAYNSGAFSSQPKQFAEERQDVIFRRVRGILNKITPETFDKLSKELINVGLDSPRTLRGLIYLLFDKALKDLKYSSLYAKLCQQLSEKSPNFETEPGPNTFCKFLISKCEDEFERRRKATEDFDGKNELTDEEFEQKVIAKQKMLGNIKFICELGKKRLLQEEILHECIRGLLSKKKERPIQDQAQDLECLCQIMRTIGSLLDIDASRNLMNQYFERIEMYSRKPELPSRIRFMLRDVIDLRNNNWRPRPYQREDTVPQPLSRLREEAGFNNPSAATTFDKIGNTNKNLMNFGDLSKLHGKNLSALLLEDDGPSFTTTTDFHWGSSTFMPNETEFDIFSNSLPVHKIDTSTQRTTRAPNSVRTSGTFSTSSTSTASVSRNLLSSTNQFFTPPHQMSQDKQPLSSLNNDIINNNNSNSNNNSEMLIASHKSESFTDSFRGNKFDHNDRQPFFRDGAMGPRGNHGGLSRQTAGIAAGQGPDRWNNMNESHLLPTRLKSPMLKSNVTDPLQMRPDEEPLAIRGRVPGNNGLPPLANSHMMRNDFSLNDTRGPFGGAARPIHPIAYEEDKVQPPQPPSISRPGSNRGARSGSDVLDGRPEPRGFTNGGPGPRDRRGEGGYERFEREPRQPKFSGANYRLPGRDRPLQSQPPRDQLLIARGDVPPEADINLNWRAKEPTELTSKPVERVHPNNLSEHAKPPVEPDPEFDNISGGGQLSREPPTRDAVQNNRSNEFDRFKRPQQALNPVTRDDNRFANQRSPPLAESPQAKMINQFVKMDDPARGNMDESKHVQLNRFQGRVNNQEPGYLSPKNNGLPPRFSQKSFGDVNDARSRDQIEQQRFPTPNERPFEERRPRYGFNRNQQPEANLNRPNDWRKDPFPAIKRDQASTAAPVVPGPSLPKPPTRMSESDFSLRPSHNLLTRTIVEPAPIPPVEQPLEAITKSGANANSASQPEVRAKTEKVKQVEPKRDAAPSKSTTRSTSPKSAVKNPHEDKFTALVWQMVSGNALDASKVACKVKELKLPKGLHHECLLSIMKQSIIGTDIERENTSKLFVILVPSIFESSSLLSAFTNMFEQMRALEAETPKVKTLVAELLSRSVIDGLLVLEDVAGVLSGGKHHPLFLLLLQKLEKGAGRVWLSEKFIASKINLMDMLPEADRTKERLASALKDRCLGFLDPMLTIEPDLWKQMKDTDPSPAAVYHWIRDNVDQSIQTTPTFAHVFIACVLKYIHNATMDKFKSATSQSDSDDSNKSSPSNATSQAVNEFEKELLAKYQQVLQALLKEKSMQLATLYAVQAFYHGLDFPKGALLRWFHMLYDLSIVDDDVFFIWKEEINNEFPGKGQALFQVNTWLNWLAEAESEDEEEA